MASYDVVSLFTNVSTDLAIEENKRRLERDDKILKEVHVGIEANVIISLLQFCLSSTYFGYKEEYYEQIHGTAMGSPVSTVVANIVREEIEN